MWGEIRSWIKPSSNEALASLSTTSETAVHIAGTVSQKADYVQLSKLLDAFVHGLNRKLRLREKG